MIDLHNHVLPNVDDGPKTIEESMSMLRYASKQGISDIVQTVHFQHPKMEGKNVDYDFLKRKIDKIQDLINKENLNIKMHLSAEVFYLPNILEISSNPLVTMGNKKYMLLEFQPNIYPTNYEKELFKLQSNGVVPIIAHPERYRFIKEDLSILKDWINRDYVIQIDAGSILGHFGKHTLQIAENMFTSGFVNIIASDAHNPNKRNFCLLEAYKKLEKIISIESINKLKKNAVRILNGKKVDQIIMIQSKKNNPFKPNMFRQTDKIKVWIKCKNNHSEFISVGDIKRRIDRKSFNNKICSYCS